MRDPEVMSEQSGVSNDSERGLVKSPGPVPVHPPVWSQNVSGLLLSRFYLPRSHAVVSGNACQLLRDGVEAYPAMLEAIRRARRYILRVLPDATVRVTIPRYGSRREAEAFMRTRLAWIAARQDAFARRGLS